MSDSTQWTQIPMIIATTYSLPKHGGPCGCHEPGTYHAQRFSKYKCGINARSHKGAFYGVTYLCITETIPAKPFVITEIMKSVLQRLIIGGSCTYQTIYTHILLVLSYGHSYVLNVGVEKYKYK